MCLSKKNGSNSVFVIMNASEQITQQSPFHMTCIACCKDFLDFQINLFNETSFQLRSIDCKNTNEQQQDVDFDYEEIMHLARDHGIDSDRFDSEDDDNIELVKRHAFSCSLCFTQLRSIRRFYACGQEVFLTYFVGKLHHFSDDVLSSS